MEKFKADMHNLYIWARKDLARAWVKLLFIAIDDAIFGMMASWSLEWHALDVAKLEKIAAQ